MDQRVGKVIFLSSKHIHVHLITHIYNRTTGDSHLQHIKAIARVDVALNDVMKVETAGYYIIVQK